MAVDYIKKHAGEWHVDTDKLCICGFSAGAHVAGSLGTMWKDELITEVLGGESMDYRPSCMLLSYPVITAGEFAHRGSFDATWSAAMRRCTTLYLSKKGKRGHRTDLHLAYL